MKRVLLFLMCLLSICVYAQKVCYGVCGVSFGQSYYNVSNVLRAKFGNPDRCDKNEIVYYDKTYGGVYFSRIMFNFQYDGSGRSYLNSCIMGSDCKTLKEAVSRAKYFAYGVLTDYDMIEREGDNGIHYYIGGVDPTNNNRYGVAIGVVNTVNVIGVGINYGPYDYVSEGF